MPIIFSGWETYCEKERHLKPGQAPKGGRGYTMYHGTHKSNAKAIITSGFRPSAGGTLGPGVYCSRDIKKAMGYPAHCSNNDRVVFRLKVRVGKVKRIDAQSFGLQRSWHQSGYDTAWLPGSMGGYEEDCVWDPKRVTVVGIEHCADPATTRDLERLIQKEQDRRAGQAGDTQPQCQTCRKQTQPHSAHTLQKCWACMATICPFMDKHVCRSKS